MSLEDETAEILKGITKGLDNLTTVLDNVMKESMKEVDKETLLKINTEIKDLNPNAKLNELRDKMNNIKKRF
jgi:hypothetical protein|tara:strand:+ start:173 stop:388 length:216 start_codon:yes stop_codon:yes gene_type:complete